MHTLRIEHRISDYDTWHAAFARDPIGRPASGVLQHRVQQPVDDPHYIMIDLDFGTEHEADAFLERLHTDVWGSRRDAPALVGAPQGRVVEVLDVHAYGRPVP